MSQTLASQISYDSLCEVYEKISKARGNKKVDELRSFFNRCRKIGRDLLKQNPSADISLFPIMRLFLPNNDKERGPHGLKEKTLATLFIRILCLGQNSPDGLKLLNYRAPEHGESGMGDFAEKVYWVFKSRHSDVVCNQSIEEVNTWLDEIAQLNAENQSKEKHFLSLVKSVSPKEIKWLVRTILKDIKLGLGQKKVFQAYHPDAENLFNEKSNLREVCDELWEPNDRIEKKKKKDGCNIVVLSPFKPMLLERCGIQQIGKFFNEDRTYFVQTKYDGERSQIHMKNGKFKYYTRSGSDITNNWAYGESRESGGLLTKKLSELLNPDCRSIILDGELMGWDKERKSLGSKGMPYDVKKLTNKSRFQPCFVAFDIVLYNDRLLINTPYNERLTILNDAFREAPGYFIRSSITTISTSTQLIDEFNKSLDAKEEGIVLKVSDGLYKPNKREGTGCYKIKAEYSDDLIQDLDLLILGGYYGEGKFAGMFNTFLVGVADNANSNPKKFLSIVSVSTGLSFEKIKELESKFKPHWRKERPSNVIGPKKKNPDAWIEPEHSVILQLRATELTKCSVHPTGYTLRFPRVVRVRDDKHWEDVWTLKELNAMIKDGGFIQKATKRHATSDDIVDMEEKKNANAMTKSTRNPKQARMKIDPKYLGVQKSLIPRLTRFFEGKEFCVINGENSLSKSPKLLKEDIESLLNMHGAKVVPNPGNETFALIVANPQTEKVKNVVRAGKWDVVKLDWLRRVTDEKNWHKGDYWYPWEVISLTEISKQRFTDLYDQFGDSYTVDTDESNLKRVFDNIPRKMIENNKEMQIQEKEFLETELFEDGISPFSLFRNIHGFFYDSCDSNKWEFKMMRGNIEDSIEKSVTHVFVNNQARINLIDLYNKINNSGTADIKIITSKWIQDCFKASKLLSDAQYTIA